MDKDYFKNILDYVLYALQKILVANDNKNYDAVDTLVRQEIKAIREDLKILKGENK